MNYLDDIAFIRSYLESTDHLMERDNIARDISLLVSRIRSKEYENTDILNRQSFDTCRRTFEFFNYLIGYYNQATDWVNLLKQIPIDTINSICDLCPGSSPKVEWALQRLGYDKCLTIVDKDRIAVTQMKVLLNVFAANYSTDFHQLDLFVAEGKYDLITANHIFDDLILNEFCLSRSIDLRVLYSDEKQFQLAIDEIQRTKNSMDMACQLRDFLQRHLESGGYVIMTHYVGLTEQALQLQDWSEWVYQIMGQLYVLLIEGGYLRIDSQMNDTMTDSMSSKQYFIVKKMD